jgi:hypothetical protein
MYTWTISWESCEKSYIQNDVYCVYLKELTLYGFGGPINKI